MGRFVTIAMCGVMLLGVGGCARQSPAEREDARQAKQDARQAKEEQRAEREAERSPYPPPPAKSKMAQIAPGMREPEVMRIMGPPDDSHAYITGKAFIPWYFGPDRTRFAAYWRGQGRVIFMGGNAWGGGRGKVVRVEYDPSEDGYADTK